MTRLESQPRSRDSSYFYKNPKQLIGKPSSFANNGLSFFALVMIDIGEVTVSPSDVLIQLK